MNDTDRIMRIVANSWHEGQGSAMYSFVSTGAIHTDIQFEIADCLAHAETDTQQLLLRALDSYCEEYGYECLPRKDWTALRF